MKARNEDTMTTDLNDDLDLAIEMLKDLTPTNRQADQVRGGVTGWGRNCYCGTL